MSPYVAVALGQHRYRTLRASQNAAFASTPSRPKTTRFEVSIVDGTHRSSGDAQRLGHAQVLRERDAACLNVSHILLRVSRSSPRTQA